MLVPSFLILGSEITFAQCVVLSLSYSQQGTTWLYVPWRTCLNFFVYFHGATTFCHSLSTYSWGLSRLELIHSAITYFEKQYLPKEATACQECCSRIMKMKIWRHVMFLSAFPLSLADRMRNILKNEKNTLKYEDRLSDVCIGKALPS